jgi:hypothetical protein
MSKIPVLTAVRLIPREADYLNRKSGSRGEIFFDKDSNTLRLYDGNANGGTSLARADLTNISDADFASKAISAGVGGAGGGSGEITIAADDSSQQVIGAGEVFSILGGDGIGTTTNEEGALTVTNTSNAFGTIAVSGQSNIVAETLNDTLTIIAGTNITIETDAGSDSLTIHATAGASTNSFNTIAVGGQTSVVADSTTDTLTLTAGSGISITTNSETDTINISSTLSSGVTLFSALTDANSAGITVDKIYIPAMYMLDVTNNGSTAYLFNSHYSGNNPTIYSLNRTTIAFNLNVTGHPFLIQNPSGINYNTGLIHVATDGTVSTGAAAQGKTSGTLYWRIPEDISGGYRYQCSVHAAMVGSITIKDFASI